MDIAGLSGIIEQVKRAVFRIVSFRRLSAAGGNPMDVVAVIAVICAYVIKGMCGYANTLVFSTIMSFTANNINISPLELIQGYPSNILISWQERKSISPKVCIPLSVFVILGSIPGAIILKNADTQLLKVLFGLVVAAVGIEMFFREYQKEHKKTSPVILAVIGILSGILCGLFGIGALLAAYVSRTTENNSQFKGNMCVVFLVENTFRIILYSVTGILTPVIFKSALLLLPFMLIGLAAGIFLSKKISEKIVKKIVIILLVLSGLSLVINNIGAIRLP